MKKLYVSVAVASALAVSASAVEVTPFGHLGAFYHQGFGGLGTAGKDGEIQKAYADVSARVGIEVGLGSALAIGIGGWGAYPFYSTGDPVKTGDIAIPKNGDVSDAYLRYDGGHLRFVVGRFDIGEFYMGKDRKNYTGVDWIYGNTQGAALNVDGGKIGLWAYWRNSQLGAGQAFNRLGYELSSFDTYQHIKKASGLGELASVGLDFDFGVLKISPFASYLTEGDDNKAKNDVLNAGAKALIDLGSGSLRSLTTLRAVWGMNNLVGSGPSGNGLTFWVDEELRFNDFWKLGVGYIGQSGDAPNLLNFGDRTRFYGYRGGMSGAHGAWQSFYGDSTYYVFGGIDSNRINLDLLYSGGDYKELSAVVAFKLWERNQMHFQVGAGYVGTGAHTIVSSSDKWQHSALAFAKFGF
ncbi:hypothetical protein LS68_004410 [Helicobacter sp. MIT 05-5293]|uniref:hypothetical protein n=1 Tax=Helicobacter sp. MIT 05-5293 TaxID=1548149 RepID=UPI00051CE464|nr:hypothetical protein [Helicobacter sp. MIT 05-5293]TLD82238.1 hypothetical protein LS68_004410 [Helicobacter sp. MIT 05-5293]